MSNPFEYIRNKVRQHNVKQLAKICNQNLPTALQDPHIATLVLKLTKKYSDMVALIIQWNNAGFNDVPASPNNRNGVVGQNRNAIINFLTANGAVNHHDTVFLFRDGPALAACEHLLPQWTRHQAITPDVCTVALRINGMTAGGLRGASRIEIEPFDQAFNR